MFSKHLKVSELIKRFGTLFLHQLLWLMAPNQSNKLGRLTFDHVYFRSMGGTVGPRLLKQ